MGAIVVVFLGMALIGFGMGFFLWWMSRYNRT